MCLHSFTIKPKQTVRFPPIFPIAGPLPLRITRHPWK